MVERVEDASSRPRGVLADVFDTLKASSSALFSGSFSRQMSAVQSSIHRCENMRVLVGLIVFLGSCSVVLLACIVFAYQGRRPAQFDCVVISPKKVAVLKEPDITCSAIFYLDTGSTFSAVSRVMLSDGRTYFRLADRSGWAPQCSRKDESRDVIVEVGGGKTEPTTGRLALGFFLIMLCAPILFTACVVALAARFVQLMVWGLERWWPDSCLVRTVGPAAVRLSSLPIEVGSWLLGYSSFA